MALSPLLLVALSLGPGAVLPVDPAPQGAPAGAARDAEAERVWKTFLGAAYGDELPSGRIESLRFRVEALTRQEASSNELKADIRYLGPHFLHMQLASGREIARGPRDGGGYRDWFRERGREALDLTGRDYQTDREQLDQLVSLCTNFLTLTQPENISLNSLVSIRAPKGPEKGHHFAKKLDWIEFVSSDFHLPGEPALAPGDSPSLHRVALGLEPGAGALHRAQITPIRTASGRALSPMYLAFAKHQRSSGLLLPTEILVYHQDAETRAYSQEATFEVYLLDAELGPALTPQDFSPGAAPQRR